MVLDITDEIKHFLMKNASNSHAMKSRNHGSVCEDSVKSGKQLEDLHFARSVHFVISI